MFSNYSNHELYSIIKKEIIHSRLFNPSTSKLEELFEFCNKNNYIELYRNALEDGFTEILNAESQREFNQTKISNLIRIEYQTQEEFNQTIQQYYDLPSVELLTKVDFASQLKHYFQSSNTFFCKVEGDSMLEAGINDESLLVVQKKNHIKSGEIVVVEIDGQLFVKRYMKHQDGKIYFKSENPKYQNIQPGTESEIKIWGRVQYILQKPR